MGIDAIPVDVHGVRELGVDEWRRGFSWPIHPELFPTVCKEMLRHFLQVVDDAPRDQNLVMLASFKVHLILFQWIHLLLLERAVVKSGDRLVITESTQFTHLLEENDLPTRGENIGQVPEVPGFGQRLRVSLWFLRRQVIGRGVLTLAKQLSKSSVPMAFSGHSPLAAQYCAQNGIQPVRVPVELLAGDGRHDHPKDWTISTDEVLEGYLDIAKKHCGLLSEGQRSRISLYLHSSMDQYFSLFYSTVSKLQKMPKVDAWRLVSCSLGSPIHKIVGQAIRYSGGKVIGITHSNAFCRPNSYAVCLNELAICDEYVVGSQAEKQVNEFCIDNTKQLFPEAPDIPHERIVAVRDYYQLVEGTNAPASSSHPTIESITVVGIPIVPYQSTTLPGVSGIQWLYLEMEIVERLKREGFRVFYKAHPDRLKECEGLFDGRVDGVLYGRFEDMWEEADCILSMTWGTTVFPFSLLTCKPCILINTLGAPWPPMVRSVIEKRCMIVETVIDDKDNLVRLDDGSFSRCINLLRRPSLIHRQLRESEEEFLALLK